MELYRRRMPHVYVTEHPVFLTWRLHGTLPRERYFANADVASGKAFSAMEKLLDDARTGPSWLRRADVAEIIAAAIEYAEDRMGHFICHAYVVMPNHVHLLVTPKVPLPKLLHSLKRFTARQANALLGQTGRRFWAEETFDRTVRNREEFERILAYIENNPVKARLCTTPEEFRWGSAWKADSQSAAGS